jgi:hypothetical protein
MDILEEIYSMASCQNTFSGSRGGLASMIKNIFLNVSMPLWNRSQQTFQGGRIYFSKSASLQSILRISGLYVQLR